MKRQRQATDDHREKMEMEKVREGVRAEGGDYEGEVVVTQPRAGRTHMHNRAHATPDGGGARLARSSREKMGEF